VFHTTAPEMIMSLLEQLISAIKSADIEIIDLTARLESSTPLIQLPEPFANTVPFTLQEQHQHWRAHWHAF
jgi:hypothetical protein